MTFRESSTSFAGTTGVCLLFLMVSGIPESSRNSLLWTLAASREGTTSSA